ncbi:hypothetical protein FQN54_004885 [Arachnomyces sp. PD_36]|nr:hypothetical protein FQN54_004885 [Arachnomyces sp. PD_36]
MPTIAATNFNIVSSVLGGFVTVFGLVSYLLKERYYLSESLIALLVGIFFCHVANFIKPLDYADGDPDALASITLDFTRLVLGVQLFITGIQLPRKYLRTEWKSLALLLGPIMTCMWLCSSLIIWLLVPDLPILHAMAIGACVTPTDPVLSNSILKGRFADKNVPKELQRIITAESGANDGLGYPFLFIALYLIQYTGEDSPGEAGGVAKAIGLWLGETWGYVIILSVVYGVAIGWIFQKVLHRAEERKFVDREYFLVFAISVALFILGTCGTAGSDDVLACFIAGNAFTWDDWFRLETMDDSLQPTIDMLLNLSVFMWLGAVCPWSLFIDNSIMPFSRLLVLGILILLFRRLPIILSMYKSIHQIGGLRDALFVGFFGPIGISAMFYLYISLEFLKSINKDGEREDTKRLEEVMTIVIWFLVICSIVIHGITVPLGMLGMYLPRAISLSRSKGHAVVDSEPLLSGDHGLEDVTRSPSPQSPTADVGSSTDILPRFSTASQDLEL